MRTVTESLKKRFVAQAKEAKIQGFTKVAEQLLQEAETCEVRPNEESYLYTSDQLQNDVEKLLWTAATRTQDYFGKTADARDINDIIEQHASDIIDEIRNKIGGDILGKYEPSVPGEGEDIDVDIEVQV
jgi:hypothetical protein